MSRRAGVRRIMHRDPDYSVSAKITTPHGGVVADVPCRIYLPRTMSGRPYIELDLSEAQEGPLTVPEFSVQGHTEIPIGVISVRSDIVLTESWSEERQGSKFIKCTLPGEPWDLEIITARKCENNDEMIKNGIFWLTPNKLLTPFVMPIFSQTGEVKIQSARELDFELPTAALRFHKYFLHEQKRIGVLTTSQLIAEFEGDIVREQFNEVVQELDDLLLLTSLATRHRCVCRGWNSYTDSSETQFYRNRLAVPKPRKISPQETLINDPDFKDFLQHAFPTFRRNAGREALRQVVDLLVTSHEGTLESGFIKCFAALETLVAVYRHRAGLDQILNSELWMTFEKDLKSFIKNHPLFREDAARRKLVYEKTSELNRVAFGTVYKQCSSDLGGYGFHDDDLWPVVGSASGVSLSEIRNRLVHGVVFTPSQQEALFKALIHLRWCVERMVLAALEWPLERSLVGEFLRHMAPYNSWREEQRTLTEQRVSPDAPDEVKL